jgi:hypothetical protein
MEVVYDPSMRKLLVNRIQARFPSPSPTSSLPVSISMRKTSTEGRGILAGLVQLIFPSMKYWL